MCPENVKKGEHFKDMGAGRRGRDNIRTNLQETADKLNSSDSRECSGGLP
jgi:hypothetical protein